MSTVVLLPGLGCDEALFRHQRPALQARGRVVVSDTHTRAASVPEMARTLLAEVDGPLVLVGCSLGGMVAMHAALQAPGRVVAMALLGTTARADTPEVVRLRTEAVAWFAQGRVDEVLRANVPFAFDAANTRGTGLVPDYIAMVRRAGAAQLVAQNHAVMAREDLRARLPAITCPALVLVGAGDALTPPEHAREIAAAMPCARLEEITGCGHMLTWEQPERVSALLTTWLAELGADQAMTPPPRQTSPS